jgi:hypothetical protein
MHFKSYHTPTLRAKKLLALLGTNGIQRLHICPLKVLLSGKKQLTGTLLTSSVSHLNTPLVHKYYNSTKYSYTREHAWVSPKHATTSMRSALTIYSTTYCNEGLTYIMGLWMLITTRHEMSL